MLRLSDGNVNAKCKLLWLDYNKQCRMSRELKIDWCRRIVEWVKRGA